MKPVRLSTSFVLALFLVASLFVSAVQARQDSSVASSPNNMVATVHPLATEAGLNALKNGGNAVDAAIASALMLGVVDGNNSGIGGGCFILIRTADGHLIAIDGREMAPAAAHRDMYLKDGKPDTKLSQIGALAVGTPGALKAFEEAVSRFGNSDIKTLVKPAAKVARDGFELSKTYVGRLKSVEADLKTFPATRQLLLDPEGKAWPVGHKLVQSDLANTLDGIAAGGTDYFYKNDFAKSVGEWMAANGGVLTADDFANYVAKDREPIQTTYRGHTIVGFPPPSSGGVHVAEILNILEHYFLQDLYENKHEDYVHVIAEAMKLAFADRAHWLGDPDFAMVPKSLIDKEYAMSLFRQIRPLQVTPVDSHGTPESNNGFFERHTTHIAAADKEGNWVAITSTVNTTFGSKVIVPGTGVVLNNQMDDFAVAPGVPNAYGLVGSEANSVQPGKRPLSSMSPTIVLKDGQPVMTVGAAGGPKIITQVLLAIIRRIDLKMDLDEAVGNKRFHHQWSPDVLMLEKGFDPKLRKKLEAKGHKIREVEGAGICQAIAFDPKKKMFYGVHDPRTEGKAAGTK